MSDARLFVDQGEEQQEEAGYVRALTGFEKGLGPEPLLRLDAVKDLRGLYRNQGKLEEVEVIESAFRCQSHFLNLLEDFN
jgi:hypothetical protein